MKKTLLLTTIGVFFCFAFLQAQNVFNPNDALVRYDANATLGTSTKPNPDILGLQKWVSVAAQGVSTGSGSYDVTSYKAYFININGAKMAFRLKFPKSWANPDSASKKYTIMTFFHGAGEPGCPSNGGVYNNERQMVYGAKLFRDRVDNGQFDGFLFYPQVAVASGCSSDWGAAPYSPYYDLIFRVIDSLAKYARVDVDKTFWDGLSNGGAAVWNVATVYPTRVSKIAPSAAANDKTNTADFVHIPVWFATGGKDNNPTPAWAQETLNTWKNAGADIRYTLYPTLGHSMWNNHWQEADFVPFMNDVHKANPLVFFQRYDWCPDAAINVKIGITPGFAAYEWQKDGVTIATRINSVNTITPGTTSIITYAAGGHEITVNAYGTYRVRFRRTAGGPWSDFSPKPAVIYSKPVTQTPDITVDGLNTKILPAPNGKTTVPLKLPEGYSSYQWYRNDTLLSVNTPVIEAVPGTYKARVVEEFGCGTIFSPEFKVVKSSGSPAPDPAKNLTATAASLTSIQLDWSENPNAGQNETGFEVYRGAQAGGPYTLINVTAADVLGYLDQNVPTGSEFYYVIRAVGTFGAAAVSNEVKSGTDVDILAPTAPPNFRVLSTATNYAFLKWDASTDNVGVLKYDVFVNGVKAYSTSSTSITVPNLDSNKVYTFYAKARDAAGNTSGPSGQVVASTAFTQNGINYKYFEATSYTTLPNFTVLTPIKTGYANTPDLSVRNRDANFSMLWEGYLKVPASATYTFEICSDDGSNLYIGKPYGNPELINHDGAHSNTCKTNTVYLSAGVHPIAVAYFNASGDRALTVSWQNNAGLAKAVIPASAYFRSYDVSANGTAPAAPANLVATGIAFNKMQLTWQHTGANVSGYELLRSIAANGTYLPIATVATTSYIDTNLTANTRYFYKIRAIGPGGESGYTGSYTDAFWKLDGNGSEAHGMTTRNLTLNNLTYVTNDKMEGAGAYTFTGANTSYATVDNSASGSFPSDGGYTQRTVAMWIKTTNANINNKRVLFEFGNSTNGLALRFNGTALQAGIASNSVRANISQSSLSGVSGWQAGGWNHVAVVYDRNILRLYVNGTLLQSNTALSFNSIAAAASNASRFGNNSGTAAGDHAFNEAVTAANGAFSGLMDAIWVINGALSATEINTLKGNTYKPSFDTTLIAPVAPVAPTGLAASLLPGNHAQLTWNDNSGDEQGFEIWRSVGNNTSFRLTTTRPGGATAQQTYTDSGLFANVSYYYKVRAKGAGGNSGYSNEVGVTTPNRVPVFEEVLDHTVQAGTTFTLPVKAVDPDGDALTFTAQNLPYFTSIVPVGNGLVNLVSTTTMWDQGVYNIWLFVDDGHNGKDTVRFTMVVNDNALPVITNIPDLTLTEGQQGSVALKATDLEGNAYINWRIENKPVFATLIDSGNGRASIKLQPGFDANGTYAITVVADDGYGGEARKTFSLTVNDLDPNEKFQLSFMWYTGGTPLWNDVDGRTNTFNTQNLVNVKGQTTAAGITKMGTTPASISGSDGRTTGNNSGVYPDNVMFNELRWGFDVGSNVQDTLRLRVYGLNPAKKFNFVFFGSHTCTWCGFNASTATTYKIGDETASVPFFNNTTVTDTIYQVQPSATGEVIITMIGDPAPNIGGVINALVIDANYDDSTVPAKPAGLAATLQNAGVVLTWQDKAYNEDNYRVYRATVRSGPYTALNPGASNPDAITYTDANTTAQTQYYYYVVGNNKYGVGISSDTVAIKTINKAPVITGVIASQFVKTDATVQDDFTVTDDPGEVLTVTIPNKPAFVTLQSLGSNNYRVIMSPTANDLGWKTITIRAEDDKGGVTTQDISITVSDKNTRSVYVKFGLWDNYAPSPWNNALGYGNAGFSRSNMTDENNQTTTFGFNFVEGWANVDYLGMMTGNNTGVFPDVILRSGILDNVTATRQIRFTGLDDSKRYNLVFVGAHNEGVNAAVRYAAGSISDTLNSRYNSFQTANLNGLQSSGGLITVSMNILTGSTYNALCAIQIEEYASSLAPMAPKNMYAEPADRTVVNLSWSDRTNNEDASGGFQLQRATDSLFTTGVVTYNLAANITTYANTGLSYNTKYWYRVRAKVGGVFTEYSNIAKAVTPQSRVFVNFNFSTGVAAFPWNNLTTAPNLQETFNNLGNESGQPSGISLAIEEVFNGENIAGVQTGNNSGIVPDKVLESCFWIDNTQLSTIRVSNLNQSKRYRFGFIGSMGNVMWYAGNYAATYTINGRTVYLNSWMNSTKIVYIGDVVPDANGDVVVQFSTTNEAAWGFNSGMIIEAYDDAQGGNQLNVVMPGQLAETGEQTLAVVPTEDLAVKKEETRTITAIRTYPNPFQDVVNIDFNNASASNQITVDVYDLGGALMYRKNYDKMPAGANTLRLNTGDVNLGVGVYMITLRVNGKVAHAAKMIRSVTK
ncbi:MAG: PA14 domain-containing protein [Candidatus Pseudobacter hemicellulosilyticus]|uniref:PA14 domain-containing protein n=1 Tax=Candidatus Pseudobacter hemicellulosilyticus TaxID=3121375 RepID=A0AAJ5WT07_9BACT|nr:MAG: PA14 domain-containing protein [Pseudobacter sp.]